MIIDITVKTSNTGTTYCGEKSSGIAADVKRAVEYLLKGNHRKCTHAIIRARLGSSFINRIYNG